MPVVMVVVVAGPSRDILFSSAMLITCVIIIVPVCVALGLVPIYMPCIIPLAFVVAPPVQPFPALVSML